MTPFDRVTRAACTTVAVLATVVPSTVRAQTIADRVHGASGDVEIQFASRPGVCGDGEGSLNFRSRHDPGDHSDYWHCEPGPVRVRLTVHDGAVQAIHTLVGTRHRAIAGLTDLGAVGDRDAVQYFLSLARRADVPVAREAVTPIALADSTTVTPDLLALATERTRPIEVRKNALFWAGQVDESDVSAPVQ
ncbi:MAG TPA: hypothetical protein VGR59_05885, partial [Gemmatimonadaceae bacterium]|nr:hypothetical protein [Gemmatimonadaceae bacterium]